MLFSDTITEAEACNYFGPRKDGTTDASGCEQSSWSLQIVDNLAAQNAFIGFYSLPDSASFSLF